MSQVASWSVEGVDSKTRKAAGVLARRSGMSLGQWLESTIEAQRLREPSLFETPENDAGAPLASIARRLASGRERWDGSEPARETRKPAAAGVSAAVLTRHIRASEARMGGLLEQLIRRQEENETQIAALVDALVDGFAQSPGGMRPTAGEEADLESRPATAARLDITAPAQPELEPAPPRDDLSEQIAALTREIAELRRTHPGAAAGREELASLRADLADLSRNLADIRSPDQFARIDMKLDLLARQAQDPAVLATLQRETSDIRARLGDLVRRPDASAGLHDKLDALQRAVDGAQASSAAALAALMARLEALDTSPADETALAALERQVADMARAVEGLGGRDSPSGDLRRTVADVLSGSSLAGLPAELQRLHGELRKLQEDGVRDTRSAFDALQSLLHQVEGRLTAVEDAVRARGVAVVAGPPDLTDIPPLFGRERPDDIAWSRDLPRSLAGDAPQLAPVGEEASGRPSQVSALAAGGTRSAFIAAARRAARAASEAEGDASRRPADTPAGNEPFYKRHKRPILLGLAAVTMMLGALQGGKANASPTAGRPVARLSTPAAPPTRPAATRSEQAGQALAWVEEARRLDQPEASTQDLAKAAGLYRQAAQAGYVPALFLLGRAYDKGRGVGQDAVLAGLWYQRAAEHGSVNAMHNLAVLYANGSVMGRPDYEQAARWFHQAAEKGHTASQYNYALLAAQGLGTPRDLAVSYRFLALAAAAGDADALIKLAEIEPRLTPSQRAAVGSRAG